MIEDKIKPLKTSLTAAEWDASVKKQKKAAPTSLTDKAYFIANLMMSENYIRIQESLYNFTGKIWEEVKQGKDSGIVLNKWMSSFSNAPNDNNRKEVLKMLSDLTWNFYPEQMEIIGTPTEWINLLDYRYNIYTKERKDYKKDDLCIWQLPFNLPDDSLNPVNFINFCSEVFKNHNYDQENFNKTVKMVMEWIGYCLIPGNPFQIAFIMVGNGQNGKGKTMDIVEAIVGSSNCSHLDIKEINDGSAIWMSKGKLINFCGDVTSEEQLDSSIMKRVVEGATIVTNKKYAQQWEMPFTAKLMMGANDIPFSRNSGFSIQRRYIMLPMVRQFTTDERDPDILKKISPEYPYILKEALRHLPYLLSRKHFDLPKSCLDAYEQYTLQNDSFKAWLEEEHKIGDPEKDYCRTKDIKTEYQDYCKSSGLKAIGPQKIYKKLREMGYSTSKINGDDCFRGIRKPENSTDLY